MVKKENLIKKINTKPYPKNFTVNDLNSLMGKCNCTSFSGGRGSSVGFYHKSSGRILQFDKPHPGKELYKYQIVKTLDFLRDIGELEN